MLAGLMYLLLGFTFVVGFRSLLRAVAGNGYQGQRTTGIAFLGLAAILLVVMLAAGIG